MRVTVNGKQTRVADGTTLHAIARDRHPRTHVAVLNGLVRSEDALLRDGDDVVLLARAPRPPDGELRAALAARNAPGVSARLGSSTVGIAGCGGLGSNLAVILARCGVGTLVVVDPDVVEPANLNRQHFLLDQLGMPKVAAVAELAARIHPFVRVRPVFGRIEPGNVRETFAGCDVIAECFDAAAEKAATARAVRRSLPGVPLVAVSGIAGCGDANDIVTREAMAGMHVVGDGRSDVADGRGIMAPRVLVAAGHQANRIVQLLLGRAGEEV
jgi:sulfur carrier protein ThiS adenylyltransferase